MITHPAFRNLRASMKTTSAGLFLGSCDAAERAFELSEAMLKSLKELLEIDNPHHGLSDVAIRQRLDVAHFVVSAAEQ